jgi:predicted transcriptional regulator
MPISDEARQAIRELREQGCSKKSIAEVLGVDRNTVTNHEPDGAETEDDAPDPRRDDLGALVPPDLPVGDVFEEEYVDDVYLQAQDDTLADVVDGKDDDVPLSEMDFSELSPAEFIEEYFDSLDAGVKTKFVTLHRREAARKGKIPNRDKMASNLSEMSSGVSSTAEIDYIANDYWEVAQRYMREARVGLTGDGSADAQSQRQSPGGGGGQMVQPGAQPAQQGQWLQMPGGGRQYGRMEPGPNGQMQFVPMQPPAGAAQPPAAQPPAGQQQPAAQSQSGGGVDEEKLARALADQMDDGDNSSGPDSAVGIVKQYKELRDELEEDGGDNDEQIEALQREIRRLTQNVANRGDAQQVSDPRDRLLQQAMQRDDLDPEDAMKLADRLEGESDPEVKKAEIEAQTEKQKVERQAERTEQFADFASDLVNELGKLAREATSDGGAGDAAGGGGGQPAQPQRAQAGTAQVQPRSDGGGQVTPSRPAGLSQVPETYDCPECEETTPQDQSTPGIICGNCDYSVLPCRSCASPVEVPPADNPSAYICPDCRNEIMVIDGDTSELICVECDWTGSGVEAGAEVVECSECGVTNEVTRE